MKKEMEEWKDIKDYEGLYQVSNLGNVIGIKSGKILKIYKSKRGYCMIGLYKNNNNKNFSIHRLVAMAFIPNPYNKPCVNHKNGILTDNMVENLEWCTYSENLKHAFETLGRIIPNRKLTVSQVIEIREQFKLNPKKSCNKIGLEYGVNEHTIRRIKHNTLYKSAV